jgi:hypothetical protein
MRTLAMGLGIVLLSGGVVLPAEAGFLYGGRDLEDGRDFSLRGSVGQISDFNAMVQETTRKLYDVTGSYWKQDDAENYNLNDFNIDDKHNTVGLSLEKAWRFFTFQFDTSILKMESSTVARRNYYIGIGDSIEYEGKSYERMQIPKHTPFDFEITGGTIDTKLMLTPVTLRFGSGFRVTPMLGIGIFGFAGEYEIDAGPVQGVKIYQDPPKEFAIGGQASGILGMGMPEYGYGLEIRMGTPDTANLVIQGHYVMLEYDGSTAFLTSSAHREKNAEIDHTNVRGRVYLEIPLKNSRSIMIGVQYQQVESEAFISSTATDPEEILEKQERFDKEVEFGLTSMHALIGYTW